MLACLMSNMSWFVVEYWITASEGEEPAWVRSVDLFFSFCYLGEVIMKLSWWSWEEYWMSVENRFDFFTSWMLASTGLCVLFFGLDADLIKCLNIARIVRLFKALSDVPQIHRMCAVIVQRVSTCGNVLTMNLLTLYLWSAWGMLVFGGKLYQSNPRLEGQDLDYFDSHFQVYNFNDMILGCVTMFFVTITGWVDEVPNACFQLYEEHSSMWFMNGGFWLSFYVASVLIAFNVWTAFSIGVLSALGGVSSGGEVASKSKMEESLEALRSELADDGLCLHVKESTELCAERVCEAMYKE